MASALADQKDFVESTWRALIPEDTTGQVGGKKRNRRGKASAAKQQRIHRGRNWDAKHDVAP